MLKVIGNKRLLRSVEEQERVAIGIAGGRDAGADALEFAQQVGREIARMGLVLISGNARGVDEAAEFGALRAGGDVIAVLAQGLTSWRPRVRLRSLIDDDNSNYAAVSDFDPGERWQVWNAMERNGTIVELSMAMVVIHAGEKGGTLDAGNKCLNEGKPLFVARGEGIEAEGSRMLIETGGAPFCTMEELRAHIEQIQTQAGEPSPAGGETQGALSI